MFGRPSFWADLAIVAAITAASSSETKRKFGIDMELLSERSRWRCAGRGTRGPRRVIGHHAIARKGCGVNVGGQNSAAIGAGPQVVFLDGAVNEDGGRVPGDIVAEDVGFAGLGREDHRKTGAATNRRAALENKRPGVVVLIEAALGLVGGDAADNDVGCGDKIAPYLEAVAIAGEAFDLPEIETVAIGNAVFDTHRMGRLPQIESVVGVFPCAAAAKDDTRTDIKFCTEAIGVLPAGGKIHIAIRFAIEHERVARRRAEIDASVLVGVGATTLDDVVMAGERDAEAGGAGDFEPDEVPVVARDCKTVSTAILSAVSIVKYRSLWSCSLHTDHRRRIPIACELNGAFRPIGARTDPYRVARPGNFRRSRETAEWRCFRA